MIGTRRLASSPSLICRPRPGPVGRWNRRRPVCLSSCFNPDPVKVRFRRVSPVAPRPGEGPLTEPGSTSAAWRSPAVRDQAKGRRAAGESNLKLEAPDGTDSSQTPRWGKTHSNAPSRQQKQQLETDPLELGWKLGRPGCRLTLLPELPTPAVRRGRTTYADSVREQRRAEAVPTPIDGGRECGNQRARLALNGAPAHADL